MRVKTTVLRRTNDSPARIRVSWKQNGLGAMVEYPLSQLDPGSPQTDAVSRLFRDAGTISDHARGYWWEAELKAPPPA